MSNTLDILNPQMVDSLCAALTKGRSDKTVKWFASTFRSWFMKQPHLMIRVLRKHDQTLFDYFSVTAVHQMYISNPTQTPGLKDPHRDSCGADDDDDDEEDDADEEEDEDEDLPAARRSAEFKRTLVIDPKPERAAHWSFIHRVATVLGAEHPHKDAATLAEKTDLKEGTIHAVADKKKALRIAGANSFEFVADATLPEWALKKLAEHLPVYKIVVPIAKTRLNLPYWEHVRDYCETLPDRQIRHTIEDMDKAVGEWDLALFRQKEIQDLTKGTKPIKDWGNGWTLVHFITPEAYKAEGSVMKHCIAGYANRSDCAIYSLRHEGKPVFTLEVNRKFKCVVQGRGKFNSAPTDEMAKLVDEWAAEMRFSIADHAYVKARRRNEPEEDGADEAVEEMFDAIVECDDVVEEAEEDDDDDLPDVRRRIGDNMTIRQLLQCHDAGTGHMPINLARCSLTALRLRIRLLNEVLQRESSSHAERVDARRRSLGIRSVMEHRFPPMPEVTVLEPEEDESDDEDIL